MTKIKLTADMLAPPNPYARLKLTHPKVKELAERYAKWKGIKVDDITVFLPLIKKTPACESGRKRRLK